MLNLEIKDDCLIKIKQSCVLILKNDHINLEYEFLDGHYKVLIFNDYQGKVYLNDSGIINKAEVEINYLFLDDDNLIQNSHLEVNKNAKLEILATYLAVKDKKIVYDLFNKEEDSQIYITNNVVCLENANFSLDCIGTIVKGAKRSICIQKNRCLTMSNPDKARVLPILNIDENDVQAAHSLSSGTIDEDVLFYMNSRGLDFKHSLNLILKSYLMPSEEFYQDYENGALIQEKALKKVDEICLQ